jgi:hypothetical protein
MLRCYCANILSVCVSFIVIAIVVLVRRRNEEAERKKAEMAKLMKMVQQRKQIEAMAAHRLGIFAVWTVK